jgi:hypothetical protein
LQVLEAAFVLPAGRRRPVSASDVRARALPLSAGTEGCAMTAYNAVRFRVRTGQEEAFMDAHSLLPPLAGLREAVIVKTGERTFCFVGKWDDMRALENARPQMISMLDGFRHLLEDLGGGLGVTDPVSGEVVMNLRPQ